MRSRRSRASILAVSKEKESTTTRADTIKAASCNGRSLLTQQHGQKALICLIFIFIYLISFSGIGKKQKHVYQFLI